MTKANSYPSRGNGAAVKWLYDHALYSGDACLIWPFSSHPTGYGAFGHLGKMHYAHRFMCELVNGPAPSPKHYASHHCGNGHKGCVHPRHLDWKTAQANAADRVKHGNNWRKGTRVKYSRLTPQQAVTIHAMRGKKSQRTIAAEFGISRELVSHIHCGRAWADVINQQSERSK